MESFVSNVQQRWDQSKAMAQQARDRVGRAVVKRSDEKPNESYGQLGGEDGEMQDGTYNGMQQQFQQQQKPGMVDDLTNRLGSNKMSVRLGACSAFCRCSKRYQLAWMASLGFFISFGIRCNMGVAVLDMTRNRTRGDQQSEVNLEEEFLNYSAPEFNWSPETIGIIDSSFFWGYIVTQIPGGYLAAKYPANKIFGGALAISAFLNLLLPPAAKIHFSIVMIVRIMQGLVEGTTYPACHGIWRHWAPPLERSRLATISFCGSYAGAVAGLSVSGFLTQYVGWQAPFYFYGIIGIAWWFSWRVFVFEKPDLHPTITQEERVYIESAVNAQPSAFDKTMKPPWREFALSWPVWAINVANFARSWSFYLFIISQPKYFKDAFKSEMSESGVLAALPHLVMACVVPVGGHLADYLRKNILSTTSVRKIFNCGGFGLEAVFLIALGYSRTMSGAMICLILAIGFSGFAISGFNVNHLDIAPRYASILMGISNGFGTVAGMLCPIVVEAITKHNDIEEWEKVFIISGCIHFAGVVFYGIFASGEKQPWADPPPDDTDWKPEPLPTDMQTAYAYGQVPQQGLDGEKGLLHGVDTNGYSSIQPPPYSAVGSFDPFSQQNPGVVAEAYVPEPNPNNPFRN